MQFYKVEGFCKDKSRTDGIDDRRMLRERIRFLCRRTYDYNLKLKQNAYFYVGDISSDPISLGVLTGEPIDVDQEVRKFAGCLDMEPEELNISEITLDSLQSMIKYAGHQGFIMDEEEILHRFELDKMDWRMCRNFDYKEEILVPDSRASIYAGASRLPAGKKLKEELDRIYLNRKQKMVTGHPVHYLFMPDDWEPMEQLLDILLKALHANGRICNRRYCTITIDPHQNCSVDAIDYLYKCNVGGTVVLRFSGEDECEDDYASANREIIENLSRVIKKYRNRVLTVIELRRECTKNKEMLYDGLPEISLIEIGDEPAYGEEAEAYLKMPAREMHVRTNRKLFEKIESGKGYLSGELQKIFDRWYDEKLKTEIYPGYKDINPPRKELQKATPKGSAYQQLMEMTGLTEAKTVIDEVVDYYKAQKIFRKKGMRQEQISMHMVFTGNPGTAKTTCARLFAEIMRDNGILSRGGLVEVGRGDLVGKYVGWTAPIIQKKFQQAEGSVLFIDEAYALVDDRDGSYGDEAINTIVQEMENHREDVVVIFAGYPEKMEKFLNKNPGLRSRVTFHVPFADYSTDELCEISGLMAQHRGLRLTDGAMEKLRDIFDLARDAEDFGNGRFVRNMIEKAKMAQARRLLNLDYDAVRQEDVESILPEDVEMPLCRQEKKRIGFCV